MNKCICFKESCDCPLHVHEELCTDCGSCIDVKEGDSINPDNTEISSAVIGGKPDLCRSCYQKGWGTARAEEFASDPSFGVKMMPGAKDCTFGTASFTPTTFEENLTDLLHLFITAAFLSGMSEREVLESVAKATDEQYMQSIMKSPVHAPLEECIAPGCILQSGHKGSHNRYATAENQKWRTK